MSGHFLIVEARFYDALADAQVEGATRALIAAGATFERISVPGALEIPAAVTRHKRENMTGRRDILAGALRVDGGPYGVRTIRGGNTCRNPLPRLDGDGECRLVTAFIAALHQGQAKRLGP